MYYISMTQKRTERVGKMPFMAYVDPSTMRVVRAYAKETGQSVYDILSEAFLSLDKAILDKATEINKLRAEALLRSIREEEDKKLAEEIPLTVSGHVEDRIG